MGCSPASPHLDDRRSDSQVFIAVVVGDGFLPDDDGASEGLRHCGTHNKHERSHLEKRSHPAWKNTGRSFTNEVIPTCDDHGGFGLHVLLLPRAFVELLLSQGHLVRLHVAALGVLQEKAQVDEIPEVRRFRLIPCKNAIPGSC